MKGKSKRIQMRHETSDFGKVDKVVQKSLRKEETHKLETNFSSDGFISAIMRWFKKIFSTRQQTLHTGTTSYCSKFGGAFGGSRKINKTSYISKGFIGSKEQRRLQKSIVRNGGVIKL